MRKRRGKGGRKKERKQTLPLLVFFPLLVEESDKNKNKTKKQKQKQKKSHQKKRAIGRIPHRPRIH